MGAILDNSGPFKEKLMNDERFNEMAGNQKQQEDDSSSEEEESDMGGQPAETGITTEQVCLPPTSSDEEIDYSESSGVGGQLMAEIRHLESPKICDDICFGDELPEDEPMGKRRKTKTLKPEVRYVYVTHPACPGPAEKPAQGTNPTILPGPVSAVGSVRRSGEKEVVKMAQDAVPVCGNRGGEEKQEEPDRKAPGAGGEGGMVGGRVAPPASAGALDKCRVEVRRGNVAATAPLAEVVAGIPVLGSASSAPVCFAAPMRHAVPPVGFGMAEGDGGPGVVGMASLPLVL
ncbi:uncharacterized protein LOC120988983 [Bufo bufo]|uniref:uncharacterized protein LOC120988983 n=1 Tax=Bufo bufo TaxID=8384 RepID=UPI001ABE2BAD|nr:uncharacterized protein LOC120988983 [Bufo bufo]